MQPLTLLMKSNSNFGQLEKMIAEKDGGNIPEFRGVALEEQFCKHLSEICRIFKEFGDMSDHTYDIHQLMKTLKIENGRWPEVVPFEHFTKIVPAVLQLSHWLGRAEGQRVVHVGLLRVVVGPHFVDPEMYRLCLGVAVRVLVSSNQAEAHDAHVEVLHQPACPRDAGGG